MAYTAVVEQQKHIFVLSGGFILALPWLKGLKRIWKEMTSLGRIGLLILLLLIIMAFAASHLSWHSPNVSSGPPLAPPGKAHLLGTDELGVDLWAQVCYGARVSLMVGLGTALLAGAGGGIIGSLAAFRGGVLDRLLMRLIDIMLVMPSLPVMIVLAAFMGSSLRNIILVLVLFSWSHPARIIRAQVLALKEQGYIKMARVYGGSDLYIIFKHLLPEIFPILAVSMIRLASMAIVTEASLAFLGLGDPTSRSWGLIINHALNFSGIYFTPFWQWWLFYPWLFLTLLVVSLALLGRDLERIADPRMVKSF